MDAPRSGLLRPFRTAPTLSLLPTWRDAWLAVDAQSGSPAATETVKALNSEVEADLTAVLPDIFLPPSPQV